MLFFFLNVLPASGELQLTDACSVKLLLNDIHCCSHTSVYLEQHMEIGSKLSSEPVPRIPPRILK